VSLQGSNHSNSSMRFRAASATIDYLALYAIMFINYASVLCMFLHFLTITWSAAFPCLTTSLRCGILSQAGLLEVPVTLSGFPWLFLCSGSGVAEWLLHGMVMLNGWSRVCSLLSLVLYPKRVCFASLTLTAEYWGFGPCLPLNKAITIT
jgi:hypothetical protein